METAKKEFETLISQSMNHLGLDELHSKIMGILYSEHDPLTLKELSKKTNYSFSAVSAAMKMLTTMHIAEKTKKGGSKKLYFSVQRDMLKMSLDLIKLKNERMVAPALNNIPAMIQRCKQSKEEGSEEMLQILEQYYQQMNALDKILKKMAEITKKIQKEVHRK